MLLYVSGYTIHDWSETYRDVHVYLDSAHHLIAGDDIYNTLEGQLSSRQFLYPPAFAAVVGLFVVLGKSASVVLWSGSHFLMFSYIIYTTAKMLRLNRSGRLKPYLILCMMVLFYPAWREILEGQANLLTLTCIVGGLSLMHKRRAYGGGVLLGLATHMKLLPIAFLPVLIVQKNYRGAVGMVAGLAAFVFLPYIWTVQTHGPLDGMTRCIELNAQWISDVLMPAINGDHVGGRVQYQLPNASFHAVLHRYFGEDVLLWGTDPLWRGPMLFSLPRTLLFILGLGIPFLMYVGSLWIAWKGAGSRSNKQAAIGLAFVATQMANMLYWEHHYLGLILLIGPMAAVSVYTRFKNLAWYSAAPLLLLLQLPSQLLIVTVFQIENNRWDWLKELKVQGWITFSIFALWMCTFVFYYRRIRHRQKANRKERPTAVPVED
jgi:hypothetical protein